MKFLLVLVSDQFLYEALAAMLPILAFCPIGHGSFSRF
jgi:hypothetical protein